MRILLVQPALELDRRYGRHPLQTMFRPAPITLPTVAAHTPEQHDVTIVDDAFMDVPYDADVDLVGITGSTPFAVRMEEIARGFAARGRTVAAGGVYPTLCPEAAGEFADHVVVGDAEDTWPALLADLERGHAAPVYRSGRPALTGRPLPRRDLIARRRYILPTSFQFSRGCVHSCDFCSLDQQYGRGARIVPVDAAIADVRSTRRHRIRPVQIWDDNLLNDREWTREFFSRLRDCRIKWVGQSTILLADDPELLRLAAESGCIGLFIGLESFFAGSLQETRKGFNHVERYREQIARIHDVGIAVQAGIIFGFDHDDRSVFERTVEAAVRIKLDVAAFSLLTPYPGTELFERLDAEGRILTRDLSKYDSDNVVFEPRQMSPEELLAGWHWAQHEFYSIPSILRRTLSRGSSWQMQLATSIQYHWFTKVRFPRGANPAAPSNGGRR